MKELQTIASGALLFIGGSIFQRICGFFYRIIVARLGKEAYGLFSIGITIFDILVIIALLGLPRGVIRFLSYYKGKNNSIKMKETVASAVKLGWISGIVSGAIFYFSCGFISQYIFHMHNFTSVLKIFALTTPLWVLTALFLNIPIGLQKIKYFVYTRHFLDSILKLFLALTLVFLGFGLKGILYSFLLTQIICFTLAFYFFKQCFSSNRATSTINWELLKYSLPLGWSVLSWYLFIRLDTLLIGILRSPIETGIYNTATPFMWLLLILPFSLNRLFLPTATRLYAKDKDIKNIYKTLGRWIIMITIPLSCILLLFPKELISLFFGKEYVSAHLALKILSIGYLIASFNLIKTNILLIFKKTSLLFILNVLLLTLNIILNTQLIPLYGINGAAIATSLSFLFQSILLEIASYKLIKVYLFDAYYFKPFIAGITSLGILHLIDSLLFVKNWHGHCRGIWGSLLFLGLYIVGILLLKGIKEEDKMLLKGLKNKAASMFTVSEETI